ncbi:hypothetical protein Pint_34279 [Pistacia integerrima]|uniref:Uncharacterized protein n=1 Tax=Pistacia integerrima TaxID=434235 RepID=A0ACC0X664_9ROSI|nr:hypothetical protein Pint_34279 [Pistacia integerrima]
MLLGLLPNSFTMVGALVSTAGLLNLQLAKSIHGLLVKYGLETDLIVGTTMLDAYAKCGDIFCSYKLFEGLKNPSLVSCNAIIAGLINNEHFVEAVLLFNRLWRFDLVPRSRKFCESIHGLIVKVGLILDISVNNSLLDMYSCLMDLGAATKIFGGMEYKDVISWTTKIFGKMRKSRIMCDMIIIMNLISATAVLGDLKRGREIHAQAVVCGFESELPLTTSIIAMYSKCGDLDSSRAMFNHASRKKAFNLLIKVRQEKNYFIDSIMLVTALTASSELAALELCQQLHCYAFEAGFVQYITVQNSLISTYSNCGNVNLAHIIFKDMGFLQDVVSWNAIINGYGVHGNGETALTLYHEMKKSGKDPDSATYSCVLSACSHAGLISDGLVIFNQMVKENKVKPSQEHYGYASGLAGKLLDGMGPNIWRALLSGCVIHGNVELPEFAASKVFEQDPGESGQVVLLSNVYASVGRFQDAVALRMSMQKKGLIKNPGISFLNSNSCDSG